MAAKGKWVIGLDDYGNIRKTAEIMATYIRWVQKVIAWALWESNSVDHEGGGCKEQVEGNGREDVMGNL